MNERCLVAFAGIGSNLLRNLTRPSYWLYNTGNHILGDNMKKRYWFFFRLFTFLILAFLISSCSPGSKLPCPEDNEEIPTPGPGDEYVTFTIQNDMCMSVCQLFVSPNHCEYMGGVDWVEDHPLRFGESISQEVPPGKYAVWVELCSEEFRAKENINVRSDYTYSITDDFGKGGKPPCGTSLTIINNTDVPICRLWISNTESAYTSWNWVGVEHIQPGEMLTFSVRPDTYTIRAQDCDGARLRTEVDAEINGHQEWTVP